VVCGNSININNSDDLTEIDNYRAIAISNAETNLLETIMLNIFTEKSDFGLKKCHSTGHCASI